jgi:hypothetical protein
VPPILQWSIVGVALALSAIYVLHRQWPALTTRVRHRVVLWLAAPARGALSRLLGRALAPPARIKLAASGCGGCADRRTCAGSEAGSG